MADWITAVEKLEEEIRKLENDIKFLRKDNLAKAELIAKLMLENKELSKRDRLLSSLEDAGVDNWEGFSDCVNETEEES
jgi:regulator of replication initiation timing